MTNKKKGKKKKKIKLFKTKIEREKEVSQIKSKLSEFGLTPSFDGIKLLYEQCDIYINDGRSWSGQIKLEGLKRVMNVILTTRKDGECNITLKYNENV